MPDPAVIPGLTQNPVERSAALRAITYIDRTLAFRGVTAQLVAEPPRGSRRLFGLTQAATAA